VTWEFVDHTGDVAVRLRAHDLAGLIEAGVRALRALLFEGEPDPEGADLRVELRATGIDREDLLVQSLSEALHAIQEGGIDPSQVCVAVRGDTEAELTLRGVRARAPLRLEIKGVTYHDVAVRELQGGLESTLVLDV
jgi:SHS2 domain-containing protein